MTDPIEFLEYPDREGASRAAAEQLSQAVRHDLDAGREASLVLSGGTTPGRCFELLAKESLDWSRLTVLPSDERWVPATGPDSNEGLIRSSLLRGRAAAAGILPLYRDGIEAANAPAAVGRDIERLGGPFSAVMLGMGEDGHFASLFPDFEGLDKALDPLGDENCVLVQTEASPLLRISLTLACLLNSRERILLCFGATKRRVLRQAVPGDSELPVAALLNQPEAPVRVLWAP